MLARSALVARRAPFSTSSLLSLSSRQPQGISRRQYSTAPPKPKSATGDFYKTFTRPVAKTLLIAMFTYQCLYWGWVKLEQDEIKEERTAEIAQLEAEVNRLAAAAKEKRVREVTEKTVQEKGKGRGWWPF